MEGDFYGFWDKNGKFDYFKCWQMKGVTILKDEKNNRRILQVDLKEVAKFPDEFEEIVDRLVAEERKNEKEIGWEEAQAQYKKRGKN